MTARSAHYLFLRAWRCSLIGISGRGLTRRNVIIILMSIELILNAVNINLVAFSRLVRLGVQGRCSRFSSLPTRRRKPRWAWAS